MKRDRMRERIMTDANEEFGRNSNKARIAELIVDTGLDHTDNLEARGSFELVKDNRRAAKDRAYKYLKGNADVKPEMIGFTLGSLVFGFLVRQVLWWLAGKLVNYFLYRDVDE